MRLTLRAAGGIMPPGSPVFRSPSAVPGLSGQQRWRHRVMGEARASDWTRRAFLKRAAAAVIAGDVVRAARAESAEGGAGVEKKPQPLSNDTARLVPKTAFDVPLLQFDFPA